MAAVHSRLEWEGRIRPSSASLYALRSRSLTAVSQMYCLLLGQGSVGSQLKTNHEHFTWLT